MSAPPPSQRASAWEWMQTALLAANLAWTTLCLGGYRPETMVVTSALTGALLAVHFLALGFSPAPRAHPAGWLLMPFLIYAAINAQWLTPTRWLGWRDWFGWAQMIAVFWVVLNGVRSSAPRRALFGVIAALGVVAVALGCYQRFVQPDWLMLGRVQAEQFLTRASGCFGIPNSLAAFLLLPLLALGALALRRDATIVARVACGGLVAWLAFGLVLTISRGAWIGLALALVAWPLFSSRWNWRRRIGVAAASLGALLIVGAVLYGASFHVRERLVALVKDRGELSRPIMWRAAWNLFREHPATGSGAGSYNILFEKFRPEGFLNEPQWAHNDYLNTLSDYGAIGFVLLFGAGAVIAWRGARGSRPTPPRDWLDAPATTAALGVGVLAFALQLLVDFHFKIPALAMAFASVSALAVQCRWTADETPLARSRAMAIGAAVGSIIFAVGIAMPRFRGEALRYRAAQAIDRVALKPPATTEYRVTLEVVRADLARSVAIDPSNAQAWSDVAYADSLWAHLEPTQSAELGRQAEAAADRAIALAPVVGEFWYRRGIARDMAEHWSEAGPDFARALELSPQNSRAWYYYAYHLSLDSRQRALAEAAVLFCLRLDPGNEAGIALRHHLAISPQAP